MPIGVGKLYASVGDALYEQATQSEWFDKGSYQETINQTGSGQDYLYFIERIRKYNDLNPDKKIEDLGLNHDYYKYLSATSKIAYLNETIYGDQTSDEYKTIKQQLDAEVKAAKNQEIYDNSSWLTRTFASMGSFVGHLVEGFAKGFEGIVDLFASAEGAIAGIWDKNFEQEVKEFVGRDLVGESFGESLRDFDAKYTIMDKSLFGEVLSGLATAAGQLTWAFVPVVGQGIYWSSMVGNGTEQAIQIENDTNQNTNMFNALLFGATIGGIEATTEKLMGGKGIQKLVFKSTSKLAGKTTGSAFRRIGTDFAKEGVEEMASEIAGDIAAYAYSRLDDDQLPTFKDIMLAGLIGGVLGAGVSIGDIAKTKAMYMTTDGQLITIKEYNENKDLYKDAKKLGKAGTLATQEAIGQLLSTDTTKNVTNLQKKYNMSIEELKAQHKDLYENAVAKDTALARKTVEQTTWLSNILQEVGQETFMKSFELYQNLSNEKFKLLQNWANNQRVRLTDANAKRIKMQFEKENPDANLNLHTTDLTSQEIAMQKALKEKGIDLWFADFGAKNGDFYDNSFNVDDHTIVIRKNLSNKMSLENIQKDVVKHEIGHTFQRFLTTISPKGLAVLHKLLLQAYGDNPIPMVLDEAYANESSITRISEKQANALAEILVDDQFTIDSLFLNGRPWYRKIFNFFSDMRRTIKTKDGTKLKVLKYNYVNKVMNQYKQSILNYIGNEEDMREEIDSIELSDQEAEMLMQAYLEDKYFSDKYTISKDLFSFGATARVQAERILTNNRKTQTADPIDYANVFNPEIYKTEFVTSVMQLNPTRGFKYNLQTLLLNNTNHQVSQVNRCLIETVDLEEIMKDDVLNLKSVKSLNNKTLKDLFKPEFTRAFLNENGTNSLDNVIVRIKPSKSRKFAESKYVSAVDEMTTSEDFDDFSATGGVKSTITIYSNNIKLDELTKNTFLGVLMTEVTHALADVKGVVRGTTPDVVAKSIQEYMSDESLVFVARTLFTKEHFDEVKDNKTQMINDASYAIYRCTDGTVIPSVEPLKKQVGVKPKFFTNENGFVNKAGGIQGFGILKNITLPHPIKKRLTLKDEIEKLKRGTDELLYKRHVKKVKPDEFGKSEFLTKYGTDEAIKKNNIEGNIAELLKSRRATKQDIKQAIKNNEITSKEFINDFIKAYYPKNKNIKSLDDVKPVIEEIKNKLKATYVKAQKYFEKQDSGVELSAKNVEEFLEIKRIIAESPEIKLTDDWFYIENDISPNINFLEFLDKAKAYDSKKDSDIANTEAPLYETEVANPEDFEDEILTNIDKESEDENQQENNVKATQTYTDLNPLSVKRFEYLHDAVVSFLEFNTMKDTVKMIRNMPQFIEKDGKKIENPLYKAREEWMLIANQVSMKYSKSDDSLEELLKLIKAKSPKAYLYYVYPMFTVLEEKDFRSAYLTYFTTRYDSPEHKDLENFFGTEALAEYIRKPLNALFHLRFDTKDENNKVIKRAALDSVSDIATEKQQIKEKIEKPVKMQKTLNTQDKLLVAYLATLKGSGQNARKDAIRDIYTNNKNIDMVRDHFESLMTRAFNTVVSNLKKTGITTKDGLILSYLKLTNNYKNLLIKSPQEILNDLQKLNRDTTLYNDIVKYMGENVQNENKNKTLTSYLATIIDRFESLFSKEFYIELANLKKNGERTEKLYKEVSKRKIQDVPDTDAERFDRDVDLLDKLLEKDSIHYNLNLLNDYIFNAEKSRDRYRLSAVKQLKTSAKLFKLSLKDYIQALKYGDTSVYDTEQTAKTQETNKEQEKVTVEEKSKQTETKEKVQEQPKEQKQEVSISEKLKTRYEDDLKNITKLKDALIGNEDDLYYIDTFKNKEPTNKKDQIGLKKALSDSADIITKFIRAGKDSAKPTREKLYKDIVTHAHKAGFKTKEYVIKLLKDDTSVYTKKVEKLEAQQEKSVEKPKKEPIQSELRAKTAKSDEGKVVPKKAEKPVQQREPVMLLDKKQLRQEYINSMLVKPQDIKQVTRERYTMMSKEDFEKKLKQQEEIKEQIKKAKEIKESKAKEIKKQVPVIEKAKKATQMTVEEFEEALKNTKEKPIKEDKSKLTQMTFWANEFNKTYVDTEKTYENYTEVLKKVRKYNKNAKVIVKRFSPNKIEGYVNGTNLTYRATVGNDGKVKQIEYKRGDVVEAEYIDSKGFVKQPSEQYKNEVSLINADTVMNDGKPGLPAYAKVSNNLREICATKFNGERKNDVQHLNNQDKVHIVSSMEQFYGENIERLTKFSVEELKQLVEEIWDNDIPLNRATRENINFLSIWLIKNKQSFNLEDQKIKDLFLRLEKHMSETGSTMGKGLYIFRSLAAEADPLSAIKEQLYDKYGIKLKVNDTLAKEYAEAIRDKNFKKREELEREIAEEASKQMPEDKYKAWATDITPEERMRRFKNLISAINNFRYTAMLSNISTHVVNVTSNAVIKLMDDASYKILDLIGRKSNMYKKIPSAIKIKEDGTKDISYIPQLKYRNGASKVSDKTAKYVKEKFSDLLDYVTKTGKYDEHMDSNLVKEIERKNQFPKWIQKYSNLIFDSLAKWDKKFVRPALEKELGLLIDANFKNIDEIDNYMMNVLIDNATRRVMHSYLKDTSKFNEFLKEIAGKHPALNVLVSIVAPFPRVAINIGRRILEYSPVNLVNGFWRLHKMSQANKKIEQALADGKIVSTVLDDMFYTADTQLALSRGIQGTTMMLIGLFLSALGLIGYDDDDEYNGIVFKIGDLKLSLGNIAPGLSPMLLGACILHDSATDKSWEERMLKVFNDATILGTFQDLFVQKSSLKEYVTEPLSTYFTQFVPSIIRSATKVLNNDKKQIKYDYNSVGGWFSTTWQRIASALPILRDTLPSKINPYTGEPIREYNGRLAAFINMASPAKVSRDMDNRLSTELKMLGEPLGKFNGYIEINGEKITLAGKESEKYQRNKGKFINQLLNELINDEKVYKIKAEDSNKYITKRYSDMTTKEKKQVISTLETKATTAAKVSYWISKGHNYYTTSSEEYALLKELLDDISNVHSASSWNKSKYVN